MWFSSSNWLILKKIISLICPVNRNWKFLFITHVSDFFNFACRRWWSRRCSYTPAKVSTPAKGKLNWISLILDLKIYFGARSCGRWDEKQKREKKKKGENGESGTCLLPSNNVGENAKGHHPKHHGNEVDCLGKTHKKPFAVDSGT